ncbi:lipoprotein [Rhodoferax sp.]|uniref:LPS translocon maturation chaperone LptM n=1 Tax=Rhodoferax sp. TaxID=50421 RepID=UPI003785319F
MLKPTLILVSVGLASAAVLALVGCGQTGPLYLPERPTMAAALDHSPTSPERHAALSSP